MVSIEIDKLTNSIVNRISGDVFDTKLMFIETKEAQKLVTQYFK